MKVFKEIGSNFWLAPEELEVQESADFNFQFVSPEEYALFSSSGRGAISFLLSQINKKKVRAILPLYTCESVIMPFIKRGYAVQFYDINKDLSINEESFHDGIKKFKPTVVFLHAYFGFDTINKIRTEYENLRDQDIIVIEDITHSMFSKFGKPGADYYLASIRKWLALPDGGVAISIGKKFKNNTQQTHAELVNVNVRAIRMKYEYTKNLDCRLKAEYRKLFYSTEDLLNNDCNFYSMSSLTKTILSKANFLDLCSARRNNFLYLLNNLKQDGLLTPVFQELPDDVVPLYFPVYVNGDRAKLRAFLAEDEIYAPFHWDIPSACARQLADATDYIYKHILSIPCDQRYADKDMERILLRLADYSE